MLRSELEDQPGMLTHHPLQSYPVMFCKQKLCCKTWYNPSNWHWSIQYRDWYLDTSQKPKDPFSHNMLSATNIAKSDCYTNFKLSNKASLRWCGLGLWWFVLRSALEGQQDMLTHHPLQSYPVMFFGKNIEKTMLQDLRWFLELTLYMEPFTF